MAFADQYVVYGYWEYDYCIGDVLATEASVSITALASLLLLVMQNFKAMAH
jgi:hypothetical protein